MAKLKVQGNASGTGVVTLTAPNTNTDRTITLPDDTQTLIGTNASGNVGIGTTSPVNNLDITDYQGVHIGRIPGPYYGSAVGFGQDVGSDNKAMRIATNHNGANPNLVIETKDSSYGYSSNPNVGETTGWTEKVRFPSTGGIAFNGDTAAANALDDYETGTWTPTILAATTNPTVTYTAQTGTYTKIGNRVSVQFDLRASAQSGGVGDIVIGGLPFAVSTTYSYGGLTNINTVTLTGGRTSTSIQGTVNQSYAKILQHGSGTSSDTTLISGLSASNVVFIGGMEYQG